MKQQQYQHHPVEEGERKILKTTTERERERESYLLLLSLLDTIEVLQTFSFAARSKENTYCVCVCAYVQHAFDRGCVLVVTIIDDGDMLE